MSECVYVIDMRSSYSNESDYGVARTFDQALALAGKYWSESCDQIFDPKGETAEQLFRVGNGYSDELDITNMIASEVDMHEAWDELILPRVLVVLDALNQRRCAVANPNYRDVHFSYDLISTLVLYQTWR